MEQVFLKKMIQNRSKTAAFFILISASIIAVSFSAYYWPFFPGDREISVFVQSMSLPGLEAVMRGVSLLGSRPIGLALLFGLALPLWIFGHRKQSILLLATVIADIINSPIKDLIGRERPDYSFVRLLYSGSTDPSFPSGHAVHLIVFFGALIYILPNIIKSRFWVRLVTMCLISLILLGGISRIYLGAHWASDVIGGYLYGAFYLGLIVLADKLWTSRTTRQDSLSESPEYVQRT